MRAWWLFALSGLGCAAPQAVPGAVAPACAAVVAAQAAPASEPFPVPSRAQAPNRCLPAGLPAASARKEPATGATCKDHTALERRLRAILTKRFQPVSSGRIEVAFGCDPLVGDLTELALETGYGHGGSLVLWRLTRSADGSAFDVLGVANDSWFTPATGDDIATTLQVARGVLPLEDLERALTTARPALTAIVREIEPPPLPHSLGLHSIFHSSGNFHHFLRLRDDRDHELEAGYTGYPHSDGQRRYVGLELAHDAITPLFEHFSFEREAASAELRAWFSAYVVRAWPRLQDSSAWWVRERLVYLAGRAGDVSVVPLIVSQLERGLSEVAAAPPERATDLAQRYLPEPLTALQSVTRWDPRRAANGSPLALTDAARQAVDECRRGL